MFSTKSGVQLLQSLTRRSASAAPLALLALAVGCGGKQEVAAAEVDDLGASIEDIQGDVSPGDKGLEVRAIYEYLQRYGYFPNAKLSKQYPYWAPLVPDAPQDVEVYGPELKEGVAEYQRFMGLPQSGRVDARTLAVMKQPRCGHPENEYGDRDPSEQWATGGKLNMSTVTFRVTSPGSISGAGLASDTVSTAVTNALASWQAITSLTLTKITSGTPYTEIKFWPLGTPPTASNWIVPGAQQFEFASTDLARSWGRQLGLNNLSVNWTNSAPVAGANRWDIATVLRHEIGHSIGFNHTAAGVNGTLPVMNPGLPPDTQLQPNADDRQAATFLYTLWQGKPGVARDLAAGGPANSPKVYATSDGNTLFSWAPNSTAPDFGEWFQIWGEAGAIAVDDAGFPWAVSSDGTIWRGNGTDPFAVSFDWIPKSFGDRANDIAASNGQVWIVSRTASGSDFRIKTLQGTGCTGAGGSSCSWNSSNGGVGRRIAVDWLGRPWVTRNNNTVWRFYQPNGTINLPGSGAAAWSKVVQLNAPAAGSDACATDIGAGIDHSVWVTGCTAVSGNFDIYMWQEQPDPGNQRIERQFVLMDGSATRITASPDGRPWAAQASGAVFRRSPKSNTP